MTQRPDETRDGWRPPEPDEIPEGWRPPTKRESFDRAIGSSRDKDLWKQPLTIAVVALILVSVAVQIIRDLLSGEEPEAPIWLMSLVGLFFALLLWWGIYQFRVQSRNRDKQVRAARLPVEGRRRWSDLQYALAPWGAGLGAWLALVGLQSVLMPGMREVLGIPPAVSWVGLVVGLVVLIFLFPAYRAQRRLRAAESRGEGYSEYPEAAEMPETVELPEPVAAPEQEESEPETGMTPVVLTGIMAALLFALPALIVISEGGPVWQVVLWSVVPVGVLGLVVFAGRVIMHREAQKRRAEREASGAEPE